MKRGYVLTALFLILSLSLVSASFTLYNSSVERTYSSKENVRGIINISFSDEPVSSLIRSNFAGEITLKDFLEANDATYSCNSVNCDFGWTSSNQNQNKSFSLSSGSEKILGLRIEGNFVSLNRLSFNISVNNSETCANPLEIDLLDNGVDWKSTKTGTSYNCYVGNGKGCFDASSNLQEVEIGLTPYCEKIKLNSGSRFQLGAWVKKSSSSSSSLKMYLYSLDNTQLKSCDLPIPPSSGGEIYCNVSYFNPEIEDYYVCIKDSQANQHKTRKESSGEKCGFFAIPGEQTQYNDYDIFAKSSRFLEIGGFKFNQQEYAKLNSGELTSDIEEYISSNYDNECHPCIVPIKFKANTNLGLRLDNLDLGYVTGSSAGQSSNLFYDASSTPAKVNSSQLILNLEKSGIKTPVNYGNYEFYLYLNNNQILSRQITVVNTPVINKIYPVIQYASVNGKIYANVSSPRAISSYSWDFGDSSSLITNTSYAYHKYSSIGSYSLTLEITDSSGYKTSKQVTIQVSNPTIKANSTIQDYKKRLDNLSSEISSFGWYKNEISELLKLEDSISEINVIESEYNAASGEEDYVKIMEKLNALEIPRTIKVVTGEVPVLVSKEDIDSGAVSEILQDCGEACQKAIAAWDQNHLKLKLEFNKIQAYYDDVVETITNAYKLEIVPDESQEKELYLFLKDSKFNALESRDVSGYKVASFDNIESRNVEFTSSLNFDALGIFLTPEFSLINIDEQVICNQDGKCSGDETWRNCREDCKPWGWVLILIALLVVIALVIYLLLQWWYKEKYESSLFKNRNDLYNLLNFISNGKSQGLKDREIAVKLRERGWKSEQINYAFKKFEGKAIMPLDFVKLFKKSQINKTKS